MARILVVDDQRHLTEAMEALLQAAGHSTERALNGPDALCLIRDHPRFDLIILDVLMPGMTGIALLNELADAPPVILMTGQPMAVPQVLPPSVRHVMYKAFGGDELMEKVRDVLCSTS